MKTDKAMTTVRSAHPVDPAVRARVMAELAEVERRHDVSVLFACESGSRGGESRHRSFSQVRLHEGAIRIAPFLHGKHAPSVDLRDDGR